MSQNPKSTRQYVVDSVVDQLRRQWSLTGSGYPPMIRADTQPTGWAFNNQPFVMVYALHEKYEPYDHGNPIYGRNVGGTVKFLVAAKTAIGRFNDIENEICRILDTIDNVDPVIITLVRVDAARDVGAEDTNVLTGVIQFDAWSVG